MQRPGPQGERRLRKELADIAKDGHNSENFLTANLVDDDIKHWVGSFRGPIDSPYEDGVFKLDILIQNDYPFVPPQIKFLTKVWHPNVSSQTGVICLDVLKQQWSPALTIRTALLSIQSLMSDPHPQDPQDYVVAKQYMEDRPAFESTARAWTQNYAVNVAEQEVKIRRIVEMGFTEAQAVRALTASNGDESSAVEALLTNP